MARSGCKLLDRHGATKAAATGFIRSLVKLTIGLVLCSANGVLQKCRDNRLLTRAFNAVQSGCVVDGAFIAVCRTPRAVPPPAYHRKDIQASF